jgi:tRNA G18 (ribose-2'-O)-methylase SpoU
MEMDQIYHYEDFLESFSLERSQWLYPVLIDIKDPMNLGGILRSAFFFGLNQVLVHGDRSLKRVTPVVSKASSGSAECMRIGFLHDFSQFLQGAREAGDIIIGTSVPEEEQDLRWMP